VIAIAIGDINTAALPRDRIGIRVHPHVGRLVQQRLALIRGRIGARVTASGSWRVVAYTFRADLQQQSATVRVFLHDAVAVAGDPDIVLIVDKATVDAIGQEALSPQATVLPSVSNSITGGAAIPFTPSGAMRLPRVTMNT
jgi:hypothetical protein